MKISTWAASLLAFVLLILALAILFGSKNGIQLFSSGGTPGSCSTKPSCPQCVTDNAGWYSMDGSCSECNCCGEMVKIKTPVRGSNHMCTYCYCKDYPAGTDCTKTTFGLCNRGLECAKKDPNSNEWTCCDSKTVGTCWGTKYCNYGTRGYGEPCIGAGCKMCKEGLECNNKPPFETHGTCDFPSSK